MALDWRTAEYLQQAAQMVPANEESQRGKKGQFWKKRPENQTQNGPFGEGRFSEFARLGLGTEESL